MSLRVTDLIGPMLGAAHLCLSGEVAVHGDDGDYSLRFWSRRSCKDLRVQRDDGLVHVSTAAGSVTRWRGRVLDSGPPMNLGGDEVASLVMPRYAYIWGRPGEDWRLTEQVDETQDGRQRISLAHTSRLDAGEAWIDVDAETGWLWEWRLPWRRWTLVRADDELGAEVQDLFALDAS